MQYSSSILLAVAGLTTTVSAHGFVTSPQPRMPGAAMKAACGDQVEVNQSSDNYGNIQGELQVAASQTDYNAAECDIWLCKGYKYADNTANVQSYTAGQVVPVTVDIRAPHTGYANVSIVETSTNTMISDYLAYWSVYASTATTIPANETSFSITIPDNLGDKCATAGDCVIQWYWNAPSIDQTYESCIDFTLGGSGSSSASASPAVSTTAVATSTAVPTSSAAVETSSAVPTTTSAVVSSIEAVATSSAIVSSAAPIVSSAAPIVSSAAPVVSSAAPIVSSAAPIVSSAAPAVSSAAAFVPSSISSIVLPSAAVSSAAPIVSPSSFAVPTTFKTHTRPSHPQTFTPTFPEVPTATASMSSSASSMLGDPKDVKPVPSGATFKDVMKWMNEFVKNLA